MTEIIPKVQKWDGLFVCLFCFVFFNLYVERLQLPRPTPTGHATASLSISLSYHNMSDSINRLIFLLHFYVCVLYYIILRQKINQLIDLPLKPSQHLMS